MADQLLYNNERKTDDINVSMPRGEDRELVFKHVLGPSSAIKEARFHVVGEATDDTVYIALALDANPTQWDFSTDDEGIISIASGDTAGEDNGVDIGQYDYAIELIDQNDLVYTPQRGKFTITDDVVDNGGSAPYLSWTTRETLDAAITANNATLTAMATCGNFAFLTVAIAGGEGTITIDGDTSYFDGQDIRVMLDSGAYEDDTVASVSGYTCTLTGTIAGAAAIGNVVRIL